MNKKHSAVDLTDLAVGILILGIVVTIGARILILYRDSRLTSLPTTSVVNETAAINSTTSTFENTWVSSVTSCINATDGTTIPSTNYTVTISNVDGYATITNATPTEYTNATCNYNYYDTTEPEWALADDAATGLAEYGNWFDIIVIIGVAAVILALIFMAFGKRGGGNSVAY